MSISQRIKEVITQSLISRKRTHEIPITQIREDGELLKERTALITGGSGGIGFAIAEKLTACGCNVIIAGTNESKLAEKNQDSGGGNKIFDIRCQ